MAIAFLFLSYSRGRKWTSLLIMTPIVSADNRLNVVAMIGRTSIGAVANAEGVILVRVDHAERSCDLIIWRW